MQKLKRGALLNIWIYGLMSLIFLCQNALAFQQVPYNIAEARQAGETQKFIVSMQEINATALQFNGDGTKMLVLGNKKEVYEYNLSSAYDLSTATYAGDSEKLVLSNFTANPSDMAFSHDGLMLFTTGYPYGRVLKYNLAAAYDVSTAVFAGLSASLPLASYDTTPRALSFNRDGTKLFISGQQNNFIHEFSLATAYDLTTAVHAGNSERLDTTPFTAVVLSFIFTPDGSQLLINGSDKLIRLDLSTNYDVSTASFAGAENEYTYPRSNVTDVQFAQNGLQFFALYYNAHGVWGYEIGPFDEIAPFVTGIAINGSNPLGVASAEWTVTFSEDVMGVDITDFEMVTTGTMTGQISAVVAIDAAIYTVSVNNIAGGGTIGLNLKDDDSIKDLANNVLEASTGDALGNFIGPNYFTNVAPTDIAISRASIAENNRQNDLVGILSSTDADIDDTHTYALVAGAGDTDNVSFLIVSDLLLAADLFDFETKAAYSVRLKSTDNKGNTFEKAMAISITDANDRPTRINLSPQTIEETDAIGTVIGTLSTEDPDASDNFTYQMIRGNGSDNNNLVIISGDQLVTSDTIDYEAFQTLLVRVQVTDAGGATNERPFVITVNDIANEAIREFSQNKPGAKVKNFFTPNGDGINDVWVIEEIEDNRDNTVKVYTQAGKLVYSTENYQNNWDGTSEGKVLPSGTYYYEINIYNGQKVITGFLTLLKEVY